MGFLGSNADKKAIAYPVGPTGETYMEIFHKRIFLRCLRIGTNFMM